MEAEPDAAVTRGQMAVFLQKEGQALTPAYLATSSSPGVIDIDTVPIVCQTGDFAVTGYPRQALMHAELQFFPSSSPTLYQVHMRYSTNGGTTWPPLGPWWNSELQALPTEMRGCGTTSATFLLL